MSTTNAQIIYQNLRQRLIAGEFKPGTRIRYGPIGKELGISATPVREAMGLLANEGFVELVPQLGALVRVLGRQELIELYEMREALEPYAAGKAAERASDRQIEVIGGQLKRMREVADKAVAAPKKKIGKKETSEFEKADLAFHMLIFESTGNQVMVRQAESSNALTRVFAVDRHDYDAEIMQSTCEDHQLVFDAIAARNSKMAIEAMQKHIVNGLEITLEGIDARRSFRWEDA